MEGSIITRQRTNAMSDNPTQEMPDSRSFEERVFARFDALDGRLTTLEDKVDSRLRDTRPIWEAVQTRLEGVENGLEGLKEEVKKLTHAVMSVHEDNLHIRAGQRELNQRVEKLESQSTS
jgi:archaellum component FlaC